MVYTFEDFELDTELYELRRNGDRVPVEPQVFDVVHYLVRNRNRVVSKQELFENVWNTRFVTESALTSRIKAARRALGDAGREQRLIGTVHGRGYRFLGLVEETGTPPAGRRAAPEARTEPSATGPMVGRKAELEHLLALQAEALAGRGRAVAVLGEAGIGKTTTIQAFVEQARSRHGVLVATGRCLEHQGPSEPYMPLLNALDELCRAGRSQLVGTVSRFAPNWLLEMPWLVDDDELGKLAARTVGNTRARMLREFVEVVRAVSQLHPFLLVVEDLQWSDPSTLDALNALVRSGPAARLLVVCSCRTAGGDAEDNPAEALLQELELRSLCDVLTLQPLSAEEVNQFLALRLGETRLEEGASRVLLQRSDGNPLFLQMLVDDYLGPEGTGDRGGLAGPAGPAGRIPQTLKRLVGRRLAGMDRRKRGVLDGAAVAGVEVSPGLLARALEETEEEVEAVCRELAETSQLLRRNQPGNGSPAGADFAFAHAVYQEVVYDQLPSARRRRLHGAVGSALVASYGSRAPERAGELAYHFTRAGDDRQAVDYLRIAAGQALRRYAYREAEGLLRSALELLPGMDRAERPEAEAGLRDMLALALIMLHGWAHPEAESLLNEALELAEAIGSPDLQSLLLYHLAAVYENRGEHEKSKQVLEKRLRLLPAFTDPTSLLESHELLACSLFHKGEFEKSLAHADEGSQLYDPQLHLGLTAATLGENLGVCCQSWAALDLWYLGDPDRARQRMAAALNLAEGPEHRYCLGLTEQRAAILHQLLGEPQVVLDRASRTIELGAQQGHEVAVATGHILSGWARAALGEPAEGVAELRSGLESYQAAGSRIGLPYFLGLLAEALLTAGSASGALAAAEQALAIVGDRGYSHESELLRLRALALLRLGRNEAAEADLRRAVEVARGQRASSLERRVTETMFEQDIAGNDVRPART
ncbi:MAG TPA: AAA family ATPase [Actinomycetota bacterium]|nr:AAA family ATPase [Actinomycetota bacterium]